MFDNMSLKAKIILGSGVTLFFLLVLGVVSLYSMSALKDTKDWVDHTHNVIQQAMKIETAAVDMETGMRGYLLAGQEEFLEPYHNGRNRFFRLTTELKETVSDNPAQVSLLGEIESTIQGWQNNITENSISLRRDIGDSKSMNHMAKFVGEARGKKYFDRFRSQIKTFVEREERLLRERKKELNGSTDIEQIRSNTEWVEHTYQVISQALRIERIAIDMETGMRGYLLAGKEEFLEPYNRGRQEFDNRVNDLKVKVSDNPLQVALLGEIQSTINNWQIDVIDEAIELRREIGHSKTMDDVAAMVAEARGKQYFDKFRSQIATFSDREAVLMEQRQLAASSMVVNSTYTMVIVIFVAILFSIGIAITLSNSITRPFQEIFKGLAIFSVRELDELKDAFSSIVKQMSVTAGRVGNVAGTIASASNNLAQISNRQASSVEQTSASMEEISGMVQTNVLSAEESRDMAQDMGDSLGQLNLAMAKISDSNEQINELVKIIGEIGDKTQIIDEIVFQTKLLSFNASVEAERAGEHGRGFAVVAQEVGNLAQMSGKAATDIASIVKQSVNEAENIARENTKRVDDGSTIVSNTIQKSESVANSANEIFNASNEQSKGVQEIGNAIESINQSTQHAASIADQASDSSGELNQQAIELNELVRHLNGFLKGHDSTNTLNHVSTLNNSLSTDTAINNAESASSQHKDLGIFSGHSRIDQNSEIEAPEPWERSDNRDANNDAWRRL